MPEISRDDVAHLAGLARIQLSEDELDRLGRELPQILESVATVSQALIRHGIRNGAVPVISVLGIELASTLLGAVVVERVFALPGLGSMLLLGIEQRDYPNVQGVLFVSTLLVLLVGFAADLIQRLIDPRLRSRTVRGGT